MKKNRIIYNLTSRGLYSELFNLCLAIVYAHHYRLDIKVNTWLWNSSLHKGWLDYFESTIESCNNPFSAQDKVYTKEKPWIGKVYYKPQEFFSFYYRFFLNNIYSFICPRDILTKDVFEDMRSEHFIHKVLGDDAFNEMATTFKKMYKLSKKTKRIISERRKELRLPHKYIGIHIRRGDKITSQEMDDLHLDDYITTLLQHINICNNIYIATDDANCIQYIKQKLGNQNINIYYNNRNQCHGFNESEFNHASKSSKYQETINVLFDMEILIHAAFFIGTYTSNLSRVVPFFLGLNNCVSLDNGWNIINSLNNEVFNHNNKL